MTSLEQRVVWIYWMDGWMEIGNQIHLSFFQHLCAKKCTMEPSRKRQDSKWRKNKISENATPLVIIFDHFRADMRFADITQSWDIKVLFARHITCQD